MRTPSTRRRLQGVGLFLLGLAMLVSGVAIKATMIGGFPVLSVLGFVVMFAGVVFAVTGPPAGGRDHDAPRRPADATSRQGEWQRFVHQSHGGSLPASFRRVTGVHLLKWAALGLPFFVARFIPRFCSRSGLPVRPVGGPWVSGGGWWSVVGETRHVWVSEWSKVGDSGVSWRLAGLPLRVKGGRGSPCSSAPTRPSWTTRAG